jgi:hypothetical protein
MFRKIALLVSIVSIFSMALLVSADQATDGCFTTVPTTVNEGVSISVLVECANIPTNNNVFGFQIGTSVSGDYAGSLPESYTAGTFTTEAVNGVFVGENSLGLYGVSRRNTDTVSTTDFTLGSYTLMADTDLTTADGSVSVTFTDATFELSNNLGASLPNWIRTVNDGSTTINDIDLAWLTGTATVRSDSNAIGNIDDVVLNLGARQYTAGVTASYLANLTIVDTYEYVEDASGDVVNTTGTELLRSAAADSNDTLNISIDADMYGHQACSTSEVNLGDTGAVSDVSDVTGIGTDGVITLKAGDANNDGYITNTDATIIGSDFGDSGSDINNANEGDVNLDNTVDIYDLVHVGRNFQAVATLAECS